jgi:hypothetical protein
MQLLVVAVVAVTVAFLLGATFVWNQAASDRRALGHFRQTYLRKQGGTTMVDPRIPSYDLRSFDGGKNWYAVEQTWDGGVEILDHADVVYPGLLKHLESADAILAYVSEHGPINPLTDAEGLRVMEEAGFSVTLDGKPLKSTPDS